MARRVLNLFAAAAVVAVLGGSAWANSVPLGAAANYGVLFEGTANTTLHINNVTINGNVGDGGAGKVSLSGPGSIGGNLDVFGSNSALITGSGVTITGATNYGDSDVSAALTAVNTLNSSLGGLGANLGISGVQSINESAGQLNTVNGVEYRIFNITSYSENDGNVVTINSDGSGDPVVFNFAQSFGNVNLKGLVTLSGLTTDQVLWNFLGSGKNINLSTNNGSYSDAFQGIILAPGDTMSMNAANLNGRFFGGAGGDMQIVSHDVLSAPVGAGGGAVPSVATVPLPASVWSGLVMLGILAGAAKLKRSRA